MLRIFLLVFVSHASEFSVILFLVPRVHLYFYLYNQFLTPLYAGTLFPLRNLFNYLI